MTEAETAYQAALEEIERVKREAKKELDLSNERFWALDRIPASVADLPGLTSMNLCLTAVRDLAPLSRLSSLQTLWLNQTGVKELNALADITSLKGLFLVNTSVADLAPLAKLIQLEVLDIGLTAIVDLSPLMTLQALVSLDLAGTEVSDLRPIGSLRRLGAHGHGGLDFADCEATRGDAELARLSDIDDDAIRTRETLAYLNTLPPWPEPYLPKARPNGKPPEWIGAAPPAPPAVRTAETQIRALLRHAQVTRISAAVFAEQIATALREVPATNGNELAPVLQIMAEVGEVLALIARQEADARNAETLLRLRISQLEALVDRLTRQLADTERALEAEKALARSEGFMAAYRKSFGEESGKWSARLVFVGVPAAMGHFLGLDNCHPTKTPGTSDKNREQLGIAGNRRFVSIDHSVMDAMGFQSELELCTLCHAVMTVPSPHEA